APSEGPEAMLRELVGSAVALIVAAALFAVLESRWPALPTSSFQRRGGRRTDVAYWFFNPLVSRPVTKAATIAAVVPIAVALGAPLGHGQLQAWLDARRTAVSLQPAWLQAIEIVVLSDIIGYWTHRAFHG